jgi:hypothetical protein
MKTVEFKDVPINTHFGYTATRFGTNAIFKKISWEEGIHVRTGNTFKFLQNEKVKIKE